MELSLFYFLLILLTLLSLADPVKYDKHGPTSRRLLLFGGFNLPIGEKKIHHKSSSSKPSSSKPPSSPPKYARSSDSDGLTIFIRPQTSHELGHKHRSFSHLLKSKLYTDEEKAILKRLHAEKKKSTKKKNATEFKPSIATKTQELVAINDDELNRCRALLEIDSPTNNDIKPKKLKKDKSIKQATSTKLKNATTQAVKDIKKKVKSATSILPTTDKKIKPTKKNSKTHSDEKKSIKTSNDKTKEKQPVLPPVKQTPTKTSSSTPPPPPSPPPRPVQPSPSSKSKRDRPKIVNIIQEALQAFDTNEDDIYDKNNSVVGRAYHFVRNMFQLSDDLFDDSSSPEDQIIDITNEQQQQHHHHSRKLLSIVNDDEISTVIYNETDDYEYDLYLNYDQPSRTTNEFSCVVASISNRQLLSVNTNKHSTSSKSSKTKGKKAKTATTATTNADAKKPKVGWAYRYRISRYLDAQKMKRTGNKSKITGGGKPKLPQKQQNHKKTSSSMNTKVAKRKLLEYNDDDDNNNVDDSLCERSKISDQNTIDTVSITENFVPKRRLLTTKAKDKHQEDNNNNNNNNDDDDLDKTNARRRMKSFEELTDPVAIVDAYERGLYKPRVGWQFRYRISRYIDSLRANIHEDQERLKLGLRAIKRKTPQELSGRRKRVLDKSFPSEKDPLEKDKEIKTNEDENKPKVGWRYRYRVSKMIDAKNHGDYIDDDEEKRKARKKKPPNRAKSQNDGELKEEGLDPELGQIKDEGRRVGWEYRYRIRRKLNDLKQRQSANGVPFDMATLGGKREKKSVESKSKSTDKKKSKGVEEKGDNKTKSVGWEYRYRVSKMREAQKHNKSKTSTRKKQDPIPVNEQLDPELAKLKPEERVAGWEYRYRIRRKLDSTKDTTSQESNAGKRAKKASSSSKRKGKEKIIKRVEESFEKILNIDDIDETPFMEYFRRTSSYILSGLIPTAKKTICLVPSPKKFSFCNEKKLPVVKKPKRKPKRRLKTKKEHRAKQFIRSHVTKLGAEDKRTERRVDEAMRRIYKKPSYPPPQIPPRSSENDEKPQHRYSSEEPEVNEEVKHFDEEEYPIKKKIGVDSKKNTNKKQFQIIGQEVKVKHKHTIPPLTVETTETVTSLPRLKTISEIIQEEASTILAPRRSSSRTPQEIEEEINEANESVRERAKISTTKTTLSTPVDSTTSGEEDNDANLGDNDDNTNEKNVHDMLNVENKKDSS